MNALTGRVAVVTGSSRGIGAAIATALAREGASVAVHGRDADAARTVLDRITAAGGQGCAVIADVTRLGELEALRESVERELGPVDLLVANAGGSPIRPGPLEDLTEQEWHASIDGNLTATFLTLKTFLPGMKQRGRGTIVTVSSAAARRPSGRSPIAYAAAKAGIELLTRDAADQAGPYGVRVNCVSPETIMTERNQRMIPDELRPTLIDNHPIRRLGTPEDVAQAVLFLAADTSSWISGVVLDVAGGSVLA